MPDTHLAMPRSLSAELAQTPKALAVHAPMTTSDATNGTAAAAAAFARLLASGDQAMQSDTENTASTAECKPLPFRDALLAGTAVMQPHPDAEILELARQRRAVIDAMDSGVDDDEVVRLGNEWLRLDRRIMDMEPKTGAGLAAQLAVVWRGLDPADGYEDGPVPKSREERQWLWKAKANAAKLDDDSATLDAFREYLSALSGWDAPVPEDQSEAMAYRHDVLALTVMETEPTTAAGFAAQVYTWLLLQHGGTYGDSLLISYSPSYPSAEAHFAHNQAERMMVERAVRMTEALRRDERFRSQLGKMDDGALDQQIVTAVPPLQPADTEREYTFPDWMIELVADADEAIMAENTATRAQNPAECAGRERRLDAALSRVPEECQETEIRWLEFGVAESRFHRMAMTFADSIGRGDLYRQGLRRMADKGGDADLLDLGRLHEDVIRDADAVHAIARPEGQAERLYARISGLKDRIFATEATTLAGLAVQLAALWDLQGPTLEEENGPVEDSDIGLKAVWNIWQTARKLSGQDADIRPISRKDDGVSPEKHADIQAIGAIYDQLDAAGKASVLAVARATIHIQQAMDIAQAIGAEFPEALAGVAKMMRADAARLEAAANDQSQGVDAFADTVAAFEAEAPETLSLPLEPTGRMIDAGAGAAGITPEQFQAAYAAAVEALKLERAA